MKTRVLGTGSGDIAKAAKILKNGGIVAFPTETVYGLGANALNANAVRKIFAAKGRPSDNPLIVHIADKKELGKLVLEIPSIAKKLMDAFWPGPLTLVLKKKPAVPDVVTAGLDTVAVRMPSHPVALELIRKAGVPIAAPSANLSGKPSPTLGVHVIADLSGKVDAVIDAGAVDVGLESTVLDLTSAVPEILRPGKVTLEELKKVIGRVNTGYEKKTATPRSPGMKYRHYAPAAKIILVTGDREKAKKHAKILVNMNQMLKKKVAVLDMSSGAEKIARNLFASLREFDAKGFDVIIVEGISESGVGAAVMNRLKKAASEIIEV